MNWIEAAILGAIVLVLGSIALPAYNKYTAETSTIAAAECEMKPEEFQALCVDYQDLENDYQAAQELRARALDDVAKAKQALRDFQNEHPEIQVHIDAKRNSPAPPGAGAGAGDI